MLPYETALRIVLRNRWWMAGILAAALIGGGAFTCYVSPQYTGSAKLVIEQTSPQLLNETTDNKVAKNYLYTQATILKSMAIYEDVLHTACQPGAEPTLRSFAEQAGAAARLDRGLSVTVGKKDDVVTVSFAGDNPQTAANIANAVVDSYKRISDGKLKSTSGQLLEILKTEKERTDRELLAKRQLLAEYKSQNKTLIFSAKKEDVASESLTRLSEAVTAAQLDALDAEAHYTAVKAMSIDAQQLRQYLAARHASDATLAGGSENIALRGKLNTLQLQQEKLLRVLTPEHPSVKAMEDKIAATFGQLEILDKEYVQAQQAMAHQQLLAAKQKLEQTELCFEQRQKAALEMYEKQSEYLLLESDWQQAKKMCDVLDERIRQIDVTENVGALNIHILEPARPSSRPSSPNVPRTLAISAVLGLALGAAVALLRDMLDGRLCCDRQVEAATNCPIIGVLPRLPKDVVAERITYAYPDSSASQTYRRMCTSIFFGLFKDEVRMLHFCSARSGEGKTTIVANLGIAMASAGQRTLLIDCQFAAPKLQSIFKLPPSEGLRELAAGQCTPAKAIQSTFINGLDILGAGLTGSDPIYVLNDKHFPATLKMLRAQYDRILIDSQDTASLSESMILSYLSDATILVIHGEKIETKTVQRFIREHQAIGLAPAGSIITQVKQRSSVYQHDQVWRPSQRRIQLQPSLGPEIKNKDFNSVFEYQRL